MVEVEAYQQLNDHLKERGLAIGLVGVGSLELLQENARFMRNETFRRLVENVKRDGALTSMPFCWRRPAEGDAGEVRYLVLSGNHRVMAAREAGLERIPILYTWKDLSEAERIAVQLSHNSLVGEDDPTTLLKLFEKIGDVDLRQYAGLDDKMLKNLAEVKMPPLAEVNLTYRMVTILFLPAEVDRLKAALAAAKKAAEQGSADEIHIAALADFDRMIQDLWLVGASNNVKNSATSLMLLLDVFDRHIEDLGDSIAALPERTGMTAPLAPIFGTDTIPADLAKRLLKAVSTAVDSGRIKSKERWKLLESIAVQPEPETKSPKPETE